MADHSLARNKQRFQIKFMPTRVGATARTRDVDPCVAVALGVLRSCTKRVSPKCLSQVESQISSHQPSQDGNTKNEDPNTP